MTDADRHRERDELRAALSDPWRLCEALGLADGAKRNSDGLLIRCPLHAEAHPSCGVTPGPGGGVQVRCFAGCNFGGDKGGGDELHLVAAVERLDIRRDFAAVLRRAREIAGIAEPGAPPRVQRPPLAAPVVDAAALWQSLPPLGADAWEYLRGRGLDGAADLCRGVPDVGAGALGGMSIAVAMRDAAGRVVAIQGRNLGAGKAHDFRVVGASGAGCFGDPSRLTLPTAKFLFVVEGLTDYLAAASAVGASDKATVVGIAGVSNAGALRGLRVKGLRAVVATDADAAGDEAGEAIVASLNQAGAVSVRARPAAQHKDLADMRAAGVDLRRWFAEAARIDLGFRSMAVRLGGERELRLADTGKALGFGVEYLNRALGGIVPRDVVLIGAESGMGKTQLASIIALTNAAKGKRVHYFALEPEPLEIERRIKFSRLALHVWGNAAQGRERFNYLDWHGGNCDAISGPFEAEADAYLTAQYPNLHTFYRSEKGGDFTVADFDRMARALADETDLIILDHVHYFDEDDDQNRGQRRSARKFRDMAIETGRPIVEIAHLRKKQANGRKQPRLIPERDDFEGSSHLFKPVKKAIILAPARDQESTVRYLWPTYFAVVKNTLDGTRCRYVGLVNFNARTNTYERDYQIGELVKNGEKYEPVPVVDWPEWSR